MTYMRAENPFLDALELSVRADNVLRDSGRAHSVEDFLSLTRDQVMAMPRAGVKTWKEIRDIQNSLRCPPTPPWDHVMPRASDMSLRDAAALAALQGFCTQLDSSGTWTWPPDMAVAEAWRVADAFIAAREAKTDG
jgi:hypothetical protein